MLRNIISKMRKSRYLRSIQVIITLSFSVLIFFIISIIAILSYYITGIVVEENSDDYVYQIVQQVNKDVDYYLKSVEFIAENIRYNNDVNEYIINNKINRRDTIDRYLKDFANSREDIINIVFIDDNKQVFYNHDLELKEGISFQNEEWYKRAIDEDKFIVTNSHIQYIFEKQYKWVVSCARKIDSPYYDRSLGVLLVDLNYNLIQDMVSTIKLGQKGYMFILDEKGNIVYHPKQQLLYSGIKQEDIGLILDSDDGNIRVREENSLKQYTITTSKYSGWKVVSSVYLDDIQSYKPRLINFFTIMGILAILISIIVSVLISRHILHPINNLVKTMHQVENGNLNALSNIKEDNEIGDLSNAFNLMINRVNELVRKNKQIEKNKRTNELKALQAQINPHFLYNTLDSIIWMAEVKNYRAVVDMTSSLAKLFRISISKGEKYITIRQEIEHVKNYLKIQKIRYGDNLDYHIEVDENILNSKIIKIIIQPIVENAIYHGIKNVPGGGFINIKVQKQNDNIIMVIEDDGVGMSKDEIERLVSKEIISEKKIGGVGISNVDSRIKLYYGEEYGLKIDSELNEGTVVKVCIPNITV